MTDTRLMATDQVPFEAVAPLLTRAQIATLARVLDGAVVSIVGIVIYAIYVLPEQGAISTRYLVTVAAGALLATAILGRFGNYAESALFADGPRGRQILTAWAVTFAILLSAAFTLKISDFYSRVWVVTWFVAGGAALFAARIVLRRHLQALAAAGRFALRTIVIGDSDRAQSLANHLRDDPERANRVIALYDDTASDLDRAVALIRRGTVDQAIVAVPWSESARLNRVVETVALTPIDIRIAPDLVPAQFRNRPCVPVAGLPTIGVFDRPISGWDRSIKAAEDRILSALILILMSPLMAAIAMAIKLDSRGPIFFTQMRYGFNNRPIPVFKFRTMFVECVDADCETQTTRADPRVTRVGKRLRAWSLDELPQFINVVLGQMSIVGPRPHAFATKAEGQLFEDVVERYAARHRVKPGITGWAQVNGWRGETDTVEKIQKRVEHDLYYIDNWSLAFDFAIIARTLLVVLRGDNAY